MRIEEKEGKLVIVDFSEIEAYKIAAKIEKDGLAFYRHLNDLLSPHVKTAMKFLIDEEQKHLQFFENCISGLRSVSEDLSEDNDLLESMDYGIFIDDNALADVAKGARSPKKALALGVVMEERSIAFYRECKSRIASVKTQQTLESIIQEEERHRQILQTMAREG
jgi:rubrerythrin